jgi:hypothetical protein
MEGINKTLEISQSKERLIEMENSGKYVFHGSPNGDIKILEPKQGKHVPDLSKPEETILDGNPAVSATPYAEFAIFRAIINKKNSPGFNSGFGFKNKKREFHVSSQEVLEITKDKKGFVYVFNKDEFEPYSRNGKPHKDLMEWRSYEKVKPVDVIEVTYDDLPPKNNIDIIG